MQNYFFIHHFTKSLTSPIHETFITNLTAPEQPNDALLFNNQFELSTISHTNLKQPKGVTPLAVEPQNLKTETKLNSKKPYLTTLQTKTITNTQP